MHDLRPPPHQSAHAIGCYDNHTESQENQQMDIGEEVDELTDGIVRRDLRQEFVLMNPTKGELVARHLHPDGVDGIGGDGHDVGHDDTLMLTEGDGGEFVE